MPSKSDREMAGLRCIYDDATFMSVLPGDKPDFTLQTSVASKPFGVEITEVHASDSAARLTHLPGYALELLDGGTIRHRADASIRIQDVEFSAADGRVTRGRALQQDSITISEFLERLVATIAVKNLKAGSYSPQLSHVNLIIVDHACPFVLQKPETATALVLSERVQQAALHAGFNEIFVVTRMSSDVNGAVGPVYLPLRQLTLTALLFQFSGALAEFAPKFPLDNASHLVGALADYMLMLGLDAKLRSVGGKAELFLGTIGISMTDKPQVFVTDYTDMPIGLSCDSVGLESAPWHDPAFESYFASQRREHVVKFSHTFPARASV